MAALTACSRQVHEHIFSLVTHEFRSRLRRACPGAKRHGTSKKHTAKAPLLATSSANARSISFFLIIVFRPTKKSRSHSNERNKTMKTSAQSKKNKKAEQSTKRTHSKAVFADQFAPSLVSTLFEMTALYETPMQQLKGRSGS